MLIGCNEASAKYKANLRRGVTFLSIDVGRNVTIF